MTKKSKTRTHRVTDDQQLDQIPRSAIFVRGKQKKNLVKLQNELRNVMLPWTLSNLVFTNKNTIKDVLAICSPLKISHIIDINQNRNKITLTICKPRHKTGPTLIFNVNKYTLCSDLRKELRNLIASPNHGYYSQPPLLVMSNFNKPDEMLPAIIKNNMKSVFSNIFPILQEDNLLEKLRTRRILLISYQQGAKLQLRHYFVKLTAQVIQKVHDLKAIQHKKTKHDHSDADDDNSEQDLVELLKTTLALSEIGPRIDIQLTCIYSGVYGGTLLWSSSDFNTDKRPHENIDIDEFEQHLTELDDTYNEQLSSDSSNESDSDSNNDETFESPNSSQHAELQVLSANEQTINKPSISKQMPAKREQPKISQNAKLSITPQQTAKALKAQSAKRKNKPTKSNIRSSDDNCKIPVKNSKKTSSKKVANAPSNDNMIVKTQTVTKPMDNFYDH